MSGKSPWLAAVVALALSCAFNMAYADDGAYDFDIPKDNAHVALNMLAQQANAPMLFPFDRVQSITTNRLQGEYTLRDGLDVLLESSGLVADINPHGVITVSFAEDEKNAKGNKMLNGKKSLLQRTSIFVAGIAGATATGGAANAQSSDALDTIVVSAERRERDLQQVPISVNAFSSEVVENKRLYNAYDLGMVIPGFSVNSFSKSRFNPSLRGGSSSLNGAGAEGAVGLFIDDLYFGGPGDFEIDLFDVERIEVLRGPQGTLFGRNTTGGSINVITKNPTDTPEAKLEATYGAFDLVQLRGLASGPLADNLYGLLTFSSTDRDGTSFNATTNNDIDTLNKTSIRGKLRYEAGDDLEILASASYTRRDESGIARDQIFNDTPVTHSALVAIGFTPDDDPRVTQQFTDGSYRSDQVTGGLRIEKGFEFGDVLSITSGRYMETENAPQTITGSPAPVYAYGEPRKVTTFSQEFRYISDFDGPFNIVSGLYFYHSDEDRVGNSIAHWDINTTTAAFQAASFCPTQEQADTDFFLVTPSCLGSDLVTAGNQTVTLDSLYDVHSFSFFENVKTTSYAIFAEAKYNLTEDLTLTAGGRWTYDKKDLEGGTDGAPDFFFNPLPGLRVSNSANWDEFTYRFGLDYHLTDSIMVYGSTSKGFRSGAYAVPQSDFTLSGSPVAPETVFSHEIGFKSRLFNNRVQLNVAAFDVTYKDLQFFVNTGQESITTNAGEASVQGVEVEFLASLTSDLTFSTIYSHQSGDSTGIPVATEIAEGTPPQGTVPNTIILGLDYERDLANGGFIGFGVDFTHKDEYGLEFNSTPQFRSKVDALVNARLTIGFPNEHWRMSVWAKNLTDEDIVIYGQDFWFALYDTPSFLADESIAVETAQPRYSDPRTWGVTLSYTF